MNSTTISTPITTTPSPSHPSSLLHQISKCTTKRHLNQIHTSLIKSGQIQNPQVAAEILRFSYDHADIEYTHKVFRQILKPNRFSFNTIIRALSETEEENNRIMAILLFQEMVSDGFVKPNRFTFPSVFKACAETGRIEEGKQVHALVVKFGLDVDEFVISNLVRMYVRCGVMEDARFLFYKQVVDYDDFSVIVRDKRRQDGNVVLWNVMIAGYVRLGDLRTAHELFEAMPQRSVVSWNVMISGYAQNGCFKEAIEMFNDLQIKGVSPNYVTLVSALPAISRLGALESGKWVHLYAERNEIEIDDVLGSALIDMYSKCGRIENAVQVFEKTPKKNVITWRAMVNGLAMHGRVKDALDCFSRMEQAGFKPSDVVLIGLLNACSQSIKGLVENGRAICEHRLSVVGVKN